MILDTENINTGWRFNQPASTATTVWPTPEPSQLDHRVAQLEATVRAQSTELRNLRMLIMNLGTVLHMYEGDGR